MILEKAAQLFDEWGYQATTINDIGEAVGIAGPGFYKHFRSKQAVLVAIAELTYQTEFLGPATLIIAEANSALEALERLVELNMRVVLLERPGLTAAIMGEWVSLAADEQSIMAAVEADFSTIWSRIIGRVRPDLTPEDRTIMTEGVVGFMRSVCWYNVEFTADLDADRVIAFLTRMVVGAVSADFSLCPLPASSLSSEVAVGAGSEA
jgi:AcrR family transcriptional regulator